MYSPAGEAWEKELPSAMQARSGAFTGQVPATREHTARFSGSPPTVGCARPGLSSRINGAPSHNTMGEGGERQRREYYGLHHSSELDASACRAGGCERLCGLSPVRSHTGRRLLQVETYSFNTLYVSTALLDFARSAMCHANLGQGSGLPGRGAFTKKQTVLCLSPALGTVRTTLFPC